MSRLLATLCFIWFGAACVWTWNALRKPVPPGKRFPPLWLPAMIVSELSPILFLARVATALAFVALGATDFLVGRLGIWLFVLSQAGLLVLIARNIRSARATGHAPSLWSIFKVTERLPAGVEHMVEVPYWNGLTLDVHRGVAAENAPTLIYTHPGSWMRGRPGRQAQAMFRRLAELGWVVLDIRYPLSPAATFPDHVVGVKRAIAWAKDEGRQLGCDPNRIALSGGSSGAHLAALAALTPDRPELQPGFEDADTSVVACAPFYGIYDLFVRNNTRIDWPFIARHVLKASRRTSPNLYRLASPIDQVHGNAPRFFVVHGEYDSVVLPAESLHFVEALDDAGADVEYFEVLAAQHGFDAIASFRTRAVAEMTSAWLHERVSAYETDR